MWIPFETTTLLTGFTLGSQASRLPLRNTQVLGPIWDMH